MNFYWMRVQKKYIITIIILLLYISKKSLSQGRRTIKKRNLYFYSPSNYNNDIIISKESTLTSLLIPCQILTEGEEHFSTLCQKHYHNLDYLCDPGGLLSRTEADLLHGSLKKNYTTCNCKDRLNKFCYNYTSDGRKKYRVYITIVPFTSYASLNECNKNYMDDENQSLYRAQFIYGQMLAEKWSSICKADIFIVYIDTWYPERIHKPFMVTLFLNQLSYMYYRSKIDVLDINTNVYRRIFDHMKKINKMINYHNFSDTTKQQIFPPWAIITCVCLLGMVVLSNYLANKIIKEWTCNKSTKQSTLLAVKNHSDRFRMGFAGHVRRHANRQNSVVKSSMMFRQFSRSREKQWMSNVNNI
ncbi:Hypothetical protein SRAE_X000005700 [Strongyloides ratti]|uniref:Uncharacterized protein n=1 Tax=Strongyloides ratti TaxID=34506 RepID=A0A090LLZ6_STRRB|nr:Hypothetical protein SRAE_X000005700 [Strongyloides ratti]CEF70726.1 Hypothetical protein SRAE_X000005700 [Strongyloides ratti]